MGDPRPGGADLAVLAERAMDADDGVTGALPSLIDGEWAEVTMMKGP